MTKTPVLQAFARTTVNFGDSFSLPNRDLYQFLVPARRILACSWARDQNHHKCRRVRLCVDI